MRKFTVVLLRDRDSETFVALVPELPGCATQGLGVNEALEQSREAITGHLESLAAAGDEIPPEPAEVVVASVEVEDVQAPIPGAAYRPVRDNSSGAAAGGEFLPY